MALSEIIARKRKDVARRSRQRPLSTFKNSLTCATRSFRDALSTPRTGFILECKKASPSRGLIRSNYDPLQIAATYAPFADAISVITDTPFFQGTLEHLRSVSEHVAVPVLCKDFILEPYQVYEAREHGADAVLLMLEILDDRAFLRCRRVADSLGMGVLTEVSCAAELERALVLEADIIGINNRNLETLQVDLGVTEALAARVPGDRILICESGIRSHKDVVRLRRHVDAFLVGSSLMASESLRRRVIEIIYGRVKVCGLTEVRSTNMAYRSGATFGGMVFVDTSPRYLTLDTARVLRDHAELDWVGVFVNDDPQRVAMIADLFSLYAVQLHGDESTAYAQQLRRLLSPTCEIWKAQRVADRLGAVETRHIDRVVLDCHVEGVRGGTGSSFDWSLLSRADNRDQLMLGGGIDLDNVAHAHALGMWGLDVSSGLESERGVKSEAKIAEFFVRSRSNGRAQRQRHASTAAAEGVSNAA